MKQQMLFAEGTPANPTPALERELAAHMLHSSGQKCLELYQVAGQDGSFAKTLMSMFTMDSMKLPHSWRLSATKSGRLYFRLVLLERPTLESDCGLLPTPTKQDAMRKKYGFKNKGIRKPSMPLRGHVPIGKKPNPRFWEWMMGLPINHTELELAETQLSPKSLSDSEKQ